MNFARVIVVCECEDLKRDHIITKQLPNGPCRECPCQAFTPEKQCATPKCGHGRKAHRSGHCHECGCTTFNPIP
jgi:hypothetical protein